LKDSVSELLLCIMQGFSACEICEWVRNCVTLLNRMVLVKYPVRNGLFGECNVAGETSCYYYLWN